VAIAVYMVVQLNGQATGTVTGDLTNAAVAEVKDAQGQVVLQGQFENIESDGEDTERKATLKPMGSDADAAGEAEVEFAKSAPTAQEVEFSVRGLQPGAAFTFVIDGQLVATATTDQRGRAEVELDVKMAAALRIPLMDGRLPARRASTARYNVAAYSAYAAAADSRAALQV
jgi:hypothetical protein